MPAFSANAVCPCRTGHTNAACRSKTELLRRPRLHSTQRLRTFSAASLTHTADREFPPTCLNAPALRCRSRNRCNETRKLAWWEYTQPPRGAQAHITRHVFRSKRLQIQAPAIGAGPLGND